MIVEEIAVRNWRGYRELHTFRFAEGFNLLVGRNEAGKSALFEALTRALFDRHSGKSEEIRRIQPVDSSLGPEVSVRFRTNGQRYKVFKRFLEEPTARLYVERDGRWELDHEGDSADIVLRELLRGESFGRAVRPEHRGLAQALWYLQRESSLPEAAWNEAVREGLQGLVSLVAASPEERVIVSRVEAEYQQHYTPTGRLKSSSELAILENEIARTESELSEIRSKTEAVEKYRQDLEELESQETDKAQQIENARLERTGLVKSVEEAERLDAEMKEREHTREVEEQKFATLRNDLEAIGRRTKKIDTLGKELEDCQKEHVQQRSDAAEEKHAAETYKSRWKRKLEPALKKIEGELEALHCLERSRSLEDTRSHLLRHMEKIENAERELEDRKKELSRLYAPSKKEWVKFEETAGKFHDVQVQAEASAIHVGFALKAKRARITAAPAAQAMSTRNEYVITRPTTFRIDDMGSVKVWGGGESLEQLNEKADRLKKKIDETLIRFDVEDEEALSLLYRNKVETEKDVERLERGYKKILGEGPKDAEAKLRQIEGQIREEKGKLKSLPKKVGKWSSARIKHRLGELEDSKKQLIKSIDEEQGNEQNARAKHEQLLKQCEGLSERAAEMRSQIQSAGEENAETLKRYGTTEHLERLLGGAERAKKEAEDVLNELLRDYELRVETPRRLYDQAENRIRALENQLVKIQELSVDRMARIEEAASQGFYSQMSDLEAKLDVKRRRQNSLDIRTKGAKLLHDLVQAYRREQSAALAGPITDLVNGWLQLLTDGSYTNLQLNESLIPVALQGSRHRQPLPIESVSYGTHEQVIVLLRLAIGVLISKDERNLVVVDDRLVNADSIRIRRLNLILQEAAESCQILIATCNDTPYAGMKANIIRVPDDGRAAS